MKQYLDLLQTIMETGKYRQDRTRVGTVSVFGPQMRFDLRAGFPLLTTKKIHFKSIVHELLWFLSGSTNINYLRQHEIKIWDEWANEYGDLGPTYGRQWRSWSTGDGGSVDQISDLIQGIRTDPTSRRHIVSAWNVADIDRMALPPCHCLFQFYVQGRFLSCHLYQRSADMFLGVPFNIASYALLTQMVACVTDLLPGEFIHTFGDAHIYLNHLQQVEEQLNRKPKPLSTVILNPRKNIFEFVYDDVSLLDYDPHPAIKAPVAV